MDADSKPPAAGAAVAAASSPAMVPLAVDLDGSLLRSDVLVESLFVLARRRPWRLFKLPGWLLQGRAAFKQQLAQEVLPEVQTLPYRAELLSWLQQQKQAGRRLVLATAADQRVAAAIAQELGLFDAVYASDGHTNLGGEHKRERLVKAFGAKGFDYVGNSRRDRAVWSAARRAILVAPGVALERSVKSIAEVERVFADDGAGLSGYLRALRPHQWIKNALVFLPLLAAHKFFPGPLLGQAVLAFLAFTLCAASVYLLNDLLDLPADRLHPHKRARMLASGRIGLLPALALQPLLALGGLAIGLMLSPLAALVLALYFVANLAYSLGLKDLPVVDVLILAAGYAARVALGAVAVDVPISDWLLAFCIFLFYSLALVKRYAELAILRPLHGARTHARGYLLEDMGVIAAQGVASGYVAVLVLALYTTTQLMQFEGLHGRYRLFWLICLLLLYWISHLWLMADRGRIREDPVAFALKDRSSQVLMTLAVLIALVAT
jgi:4-hydroxybenzoate polyprenyltransferase